MRAAFYFLIVLFAMLQALVTTFWMKGSGIKIFTNVFQAFYGAVPGWSALAFSVGWYWLALPLASLVWLFLAWRERTQRRNASAVAGVSLFGLLAMLYAMYPLHVMARYN